jgi:hypothetical protein
MYCVQARGSTCTHDSHQCCVQLFVASSCKPIQQFKALHKIVSSVLWMQQLPFRSVILQLVEEGGGAGVHNYTVANCPNIIGGPGELLQRFVPSAVAACTLTSFCTSSNQMTSLKLYNILTS